jgi:hypothetical protein
MIHKYDVVLGRGAKKSTPHDSVPMLLTAHVPYVTPTQLPEAL